MKLEVGKAYRTRDGRKVIVTEMDGDDEYPFLGRDADRLPYYFSKYGQNIVPHCRPRLDLIAEWTDEPTTAPEHGGAPLHTLVDDPRTDAARQCLAGNGKTLRDELAMAALTGLILRLKINPGSYHDPEREAENAYLYADSMMAERAKAGA